MTEDRTPEGWRVPQRPAMIGAALVPLALVVAVVVAGRFYERDLRPRRYQPVTTFPSPGIETYVHDGLGDPARPPSKARREPALEAAKRSVVATGLAGWR